MSIYRVFIISLTVCLLMASLPQAALADCASSFEKAAKTGKRGETAAKKEDWKAAERLFSQAASQYKTAGHTCKGEEAAEAKKLAAKFEGYANRAESSKLTQKYNNDAAKSAEFSAEAGRFSQQKKWLKAAAMYDKAANVINKYTRSKNRDIRAHASARYETYKANASTVRSNANK